MTMKFIMPQLGMTMTEGTIEKWLVADGSEVKEGDDVVEISTEKLTNTVQAPATGVLKIIAQEGETIACAEDIAEIS